MLRVNSGDVEAHWRRGWVGGVVAQRKTEGEVRCETGALESYRDFINALGEARLNSPDEIKVIAGGARWEGKISGPSGGAAFAGRVRGEGVSYESTAFDTVDGDLSFSPDELTFSRAHVRGGPMDAAIVLV